MKSAVKVVGAFAMAASQKQFEYHVCYGVSDRVTFTNSTWLGADIPESQRKQEDILTCPLEATAWRHQTEGRFT